MPYYNRMFDSLENYNIFNDGEKMTREGQDNRKTSSNSSSQTDTENSSNTTSESDRKFSDLPQSKLENLDDNGYVTEHSKDSSSASDTQKGMAESKTTANGTDDNVYHETISRTNSDKIEILRKYQSEINAVYTLIFKDLDVLFYSLCD